MNLHINQITQGYADGNYHMKAKGCIAASAGKEDNLAHHPVSCASVSPPPLSTGKWRVLLKPGQCSPANHRCGADGSDLSVRAYPLFHELPGRLRGNGRA